MKLWCVYRTFLAKKSPFSQIITIFVWRKYENIPKRGPQWSYGVSIELFLAKNHLFQKLLPFSYGGRMKIFLRGDLSEAMVCLSSFSGQKITFFNSYYHFRMEEVLNFSSGGTSMKLWCVYQTFSGQKITFFTNYYHFRMEEEWNFYYRGTSVKL